MDINYSMLRGTGHQVRTCQGSSSARRATAPWLHLQSASERLHRPARKCWHAIIPAARNTVKPGDFKQRGLTYCIIKNCCEHIKINWRKIQCCGSGMFIPDPGCLSRIPDPDFYPFRIPDLGSRISNPGSRNSNKREG